MSAALDAALLRVGIDAGYKDRRAALAKRLEGDGWTAADIETLAAKAKTARNPAGLVMHWLKDPAAAREMVEARQSTKEESNDRKSQAVTGCGMAFVTDDNPYGWALEEHHRWNDHNQPGKWNAYRVAYNLTAKERAAAGALDHKIRGCTRHEVIGETVQQGKAWHGMSENSKPAESAKDSTNDKTEKGRAKEDAPMSRLESIVEKAIQQNRRGLARKSAASFTPKRPKAG